MIDKLEPPEDEERTHQSQNCFGNQHYNPDGSPEKSLKEKGEEAALKMKEKMEEARKVFSQKFKGLF